MQVEKISIETLIPYANNARTHSEAQVAQIAASIREFGFNNPVLIDEQSSIIAGHGRVLAARKLELDSVPCIRLNHLSETQRRAYIIADNKIAMNAGWDEELLALELAELTEFGVNMDLMGFSPVEYAGVINGENDATEEWVGMPEFEQNDAMPLRSIIVHFEAQTFVNDFAERMGQSLTDKTKYIYHPKQIKNDLKDLRYKEEE